MTFTLIGGINGISGDLLFINKHFSNTLLNLLNQEHQIGYCPVCITFKIRDYLPYSNELLDFENKVTDLFVSIRSNYQKGIVGLNWEYYLEPSNTFTILEKLSENIGNSPEPVESSVDDLIKTYPNMMKTNNFLINSLSGIAELFDLAEKIGVPFSIDLDGSIENLDYISNRKDINQIILQDDIGYFYTAPIVGTYSPKIDLSPLELEELPDFEIQFKQTSEYKRYYNEITDNYYVLESIPESFTYFSQEEFTQNYFEEKSVINYVEIKQGISDSEQSSVEYQFKESITTEMEQKLLAVVDESEDDVFASLAYKSSFSFFYDEVDSVFIKITSHDINYFIKKFNFIIKGINTIEQKYKGYSESIEIAEILLNELYYMGDPLATGYDDPLCSTPTELLPDQFDLQLKSEPMTLEIFNSTFVFTNLTNATSGNIPLKIITNSYSRSSGYPQIPMITLIIESPINQTLSEINVVLENETLLEEIIIPITTIEAGKESIPGIVGNIPYWPLEKWNWGSNTVENVKYNTINLFPLQYYIETNNGTYYENIRISIKTKIEEPDYRTVNMEAYPNVITLGPSSEIYEFLRVFNDYKAEDNSSNINIKAEIPLGLIINDTDGTVTDVNGKSEINWHIPDLKNNPDNYSKFLYFSIKSPEEIPSITKSIVNITVSYLVGDSNEENSMSVPIIFVPLDFVDLEIIDLNIPNTIGIDTSYNISTKILNNGSSSIAMVPVRLYLDEEMIYFETIPEIKPNEIKDVNFNFTPTDLGTINVTSAVVISPLEVNIYNNIFRNQVQVVNDISPPTTNIAIFGTNGNNNWYTSEIQVTLAATDNEGGSGVAYTEYSTSNWIEYLDPFTLDNEGTKNIYYYSTDNAKNNEPIKTQIVNIDKTPPVISIDTPNPYGLYTIGMELNFSATDSISGVATIEGELTNTSGYPQVVTNNYVPDPGVYTLVVYATDQAGNTALSDEVFFVVYDPAGGFATGGGWLIPNSDSTLPGGRANFGFVAKYHKDNSIGNLEFQYKDADINLKSTSIDWLVISGVSAQFQGTGTINGQGLYTFRVMAKDNGEPGADVDHFDIKIWDGIDTEADPYHKAKNTLAGGNIVVHKK